MKGWSGTLMDLRAGKKVGSMEQNERDSEENLQVGTPRFRQYS